MSILVACIGNIFQGDDAFGCEVANALARKQLPADVRVVDFGIRGLDLTYALLDTHDLVILVDAVTRGSQPGTLYVIDPELPRLEDSDSYLDAHSMNPVQVLKAARQMGARLDRVLLVGCEPADLGGDEGRMGLTPPVGAAITEAAQLVESLVERELQRV